MSRTFFNDRGKAYAALAGNTLRKNEREKDRLRVSGGKSYAIDERVLEEAATEGAEVLEIVEKTISGGKRIFRIPLRDIYRLGRRLTIAGISRLTVPLAACELISGLEEPWRLADREELLQTEARREEVAVIRAEQGLLFSNQEKDYWKTRLQHET
ncbi:hypothetical protein SDC9_58258 [bioreactor metagenome]|uniref:Uncharacterized protein n=1 Tax=bioreactor metagenome TaxID=1076179 RepID=A0A644X7K2_9ZZZZ